MNWHFNLFHEIKLELSKLVRDAHYIQRLPCVEGHSHSYVTSPTSAAAVCRGLCSLTHSRWYGALAVLRTSHCAEKCAKVRSHLMPLRGKSVQRWGVTWRPCVEKRVEARSHLMPRCASYRPSKFRWTITPVIYAHKKWCSTRSNSIVSL